MSEHRLIERRQSSDVPLKLIFESLDANGEVEASARRLMHIAQFIID